MLEIIRCLLLVSLLSFTSWSAAAAPTDNPARTYNLSWTDHLKWTTVVDVTTMPGKTVDEQFAAAQVKLATGGVIYFPAGTYRFSDTIKLNNGIILRGANPTGVTDARQEGYDPPSKLEFPRYKFSNQGSGTPLDTAFKGIVLSDPLHSQVGVVNLSINNGHIHFADTPEHACGRDKLVLGCLFRNAAVADSAIPDSKIGQHAWQRFTARHHAAVNVHAQENILIANNRLPRSGEANFTMNGYKAEGSNPDKKAKEKKIVLSVDGVVFDYDNRPGFYINDYGMGAAGGQDPDGNPTDQPWCFRKGIVICENYLFMTGRCTISFTGDGTICRDNVIRFAKGVWRPTATGKALTGGASTNDNRAVQMRGYRWKVNNNNYEVYRNISYDKAYEINDGEGLMHEDHVNSTVLDSELLNNIGNSYISIYKTGGIDGLLVRNNQIKTPGGIAAIFVVADKNKGRFPIKNVTIENNITAGGGIMVAGSPAAKVVVRGNKNVGAAGIKLQNDAQAELRDNENYTIITGGGK